LFLTISFKNKSLKTQKQNIEKTLDKTLKENLALKAALESSKKSEEIKQSDKKISFSDKESIISKIYKHYSNSHIPNFKIDYNNLINKIPSIRSYYKALEDIYFNTQEGITALSNYAGTIIKHEKDYSNPFICNIDLVNTSSYFDIHGEYETKNKLEIIRRRIFSIVELHNGNLISSTGDGYIIVFRNKDSALKCCTRIKEDISIEFGFLTRIILADLSSPVEKRIRELKEYEKSVNPDQIGLITNQYFELGPDLIKLKD
jgi:hypothetical protein